MKYKDRDCNIRRIITAALLVSKESLSIIMFFLVYLLAIFPLFKYKQYYIQYGNITRKARLSAVLLSNFFSSFTSFNIMIEYKMISALLHRVRESPTKMRLRNSLTVVITCGVVLL